MKNVRMKLCDVSILLTVFLLSAPVFSGALSSSIAILSAVATSVISAAEEMRNSEDSGAAVTGCDNHCMFLEDLGGLPGCHTTDSAPTPGNTFLGCTLSAYPGCMKHDSTLHAVDNLVSCLVAGSGETVLIGHGNDGIVITGDGQNPSNPDHFITTWNKGRWEASLRKIGAQKYPIFTILSCHTGAGEEGADLLFAIAQVIGKSVRARTGLTYCNNGEIIFEPGSTWQIASPEQRPKPIPDSRPQARVNDLFAYEDQAVSKTMPLDSVTDVLVYSVISTGTGVKIDSPRIRLVNADAQDLLRLVSFESALKINGHLMAIITAMLEIFFTDHAGNSQVRRYAVYNDRFLEDQSFPGTLYPAIQSLRSALRR
ncbi:MAG: hypothetical protein WCK42_06255 [Myxococcaceae bacterium]